MPATGSFCARAESPTTSNDFLPLEPQTGAGSREFYSSVVVTEGKICVRVELSAAQGCRSRAAIHESLPHAIRGKAEEGFGVGSRKGPERRLGVEWRHLEAECYEHDHQPAAKEG